MPLIETVGKILTPVGKAGFNPFSPTNAAAQSLAAGTYSFYAAGMTEPVSAYYTGANYLDGSAWIKVFANTSRSAATLNLIDKSIPFSKILVRRTDGIYGIVRFSNSSQVFNTNLPGYTGSSSTNNFGGTGIKVILGGGGAHGIYNAAQGSCSWSSVVSGSIGAGYEPCGTFPNDLLNGYNPSDSGPVYSNQGGTMEYFVTW